MDNTFAREAANPVLNWEEEDANILNDLTILTLPKRPGMKTRMLASKGKKKKVWMITKMKKKKKKTMGTQKKKNLIPCLKWDISTLIIVNLGMTWNMLYTTYEYKWIQTIRRLNLMIL
ncbi:hypothetical protein QQP08_005888 [Theobroma cacao]|nr:hypothetical protein QQP08_005888 [Theobroma cacao]